jgi:periplasmic protein CpxP/Spy
LIYHWKGNNMNKFSKRLVVSLAAGVTAVGIGSAAFAAAGSADCDHMGMGHGGMSMRGHDGERDGKFGERMKERMAKHHAALHDKLKLTAAQEPAWKTFTAEMMPNDMPQRPDRAEIAKLPAPERMEKMMSLMKDNQQRMEKRLAALKTFYATLTPEQKKVFDAEFGPGRRHDRS